MTSLSSPKDDSRARPLWRRRDTWAIAATSTLLLAGCGSRSPLPDDAACYAGAPTCIAPSTDAIAGGCAAPKVVSPTCDLASHAWSCPEGSRVYARTAESPTTCHPFENAAGAWGLGGFSSIPTDDGRCLWIADSANTSLGLQRNVAFEPDPSAPFGTCPAQSLITPARIVSLQGGDDPSVWVQIDGGYRLGGVTHVVYRLFKVDPEAALGVTEYAGGIARWDPQTQRIVVPAPATPHPWGLDLDLGDAVLPSPDGAHAYIWGCAQKAPQLFLEQGCELSRVNASGSIELFTKAGTWLATTDSSQGATLFAAGTWTSSVVSTARGFEHVYISDFGNALETHTASAVTGPWSDGPSLGACDLAAGDPRSFCGGPAVHQELSDPTHPGELAITYAVGSTGKRSSDAAAYSARLVWVR